MMAVDFINRPGSVLMKIRSALDKVDVLVTSGGVSMGEKVFDNLYFTRNGSIKK